MRRDQHPHADPDDPHQAGARNKPDPAHINQPLIRRATADDTPAIVALHLDSFTPSTHLAAILGGRYLRDVYLRALKCQAMVAYVATDQKQIVAFATATMGSYTQASIVPEDIAALWHNRHYLRPALFRRMLGRAVGARRFRALAITPYAQEYVTAVAKDYRGCGLAGKLRGLMMDECARLGAARIYTGVMQSNLPMLRACEKGGFRVLMKESIGRTVYLVRELRPGEV